MEKRFLGRSGLEVSVFGFGLMTFGAGEGFFGAIGNTGIEDARRQVNLALDAGITLFDTSDNYSDGQSEEILGRTLGPRRKNVVLATKVFGRTGDGDHDVGLSRRHIIAACDASLRRLGTDWIDLYQVHNFDGLVPLEETLRALDDLVRAGKVRHIGCSNHMAWQLTRALWVSDRDRLEHYISQQIQYSLIVRDAENELLPAALELGVGSIIYSPLAQGYLTGKFRQGQADDTRLGTMSRQLAAFDTERSRSLVDLMAEIAGAHEGVTIGQVALNWVRARPGISSVLIGARTEDQLRDNLASANWELTPDDIDRLDEASVISLTAPRVSYPRSAQRVFHPERNPAPFARFPRS